MDLRTSILAEHSKLHTRSIAQWIGNEPERVAALIHILLTDEYRVVQRAAWVVSDVATLHPEAIQLHVPDLVEKLKDNTAHIAVKRNLYRI